MESVFAAFALIASLCLAAWGYRRVGCFGAMIIFVVAVVSLCILENYVLSLCKWCDDRRAEKARQAEVLKAHEAEAARIAEANRQEEEAAAEAKRRQEDKYEKIQTFALKEAPKVWEVYQSLQSEIDVQNGKIEELRKTLEAFGKVPEQDEDFNRICNLRDEMIRSHKSLRAKLEDAYIAAKKYEASPSRKDYHDVMKRTLEDGINDAVMATERYKAMTRQK